MATPVTGTTHQPQDPAGPARAIAGIVTILAGLLALAGVVVVINQLTQPGGAVAVLVEADAVQLAEVTGLPEGTWLELGSGDDGAVSAGAPAAPLTLQVAELPAVLRALTELPVLAVGLVALVGALVLRRLLLEIAAGRPFAERNPSRLRWLAGTVLVGAVLPGALSTLATVAVLEHLGAADADSPLGFRILEVSPGPLVVVAVLFVVAEVFRHGQRLTSDVEGLV